MEDYLNRRAMDTELGLQLKEAYSTSSLVCWKHNFFLRSKGRVADIRLGLLVIWVRCGLGDLVTGI